MFGPLFHSFVLAQVFGLYFIIMAIIMASRHVFYREMIRRMDPFNPAVLFAASIGFLLGLLLVIVHNIWAWDPRLVITLVAWFILIKSIIWLALPVRAMSLCKKMYAGSGYFVAAIILFLVGLFLLVMGFYLYIPPEHIDVPFIEAY